MQLTGLWCGSGTGSGQRCQQHRGVRVSWCAQYLLGRSDLDDPAQMHHRDPVRERPRQAQIVGDDQRRQPELVTQLQHQLHDLLAYRRIHRGHRLVGAQQAGRQRERPRDHHPLSLPPGELTGIAVDELLRRVQSGLRQCLGHPVGLAVDEHPARGRALQPEQRPGERRLPAPLTRPPAPRSPRRDGPCAGPNATAPESTAASSIDPHDTRPGSPASRKESVTSAMIADATVRVVRPARARAPETGP